MVGVRSATQERMVARLGGVLLAVGVTGMVLFSIAALVDDPRSEPTVTERAEAAPVTTTTTTTTTTIPGPDHEVKASTELASPDGVISTYGTPNGDIVGEVGLWYGYEMTMPIVEDRGKWLRIMLPERPNESTAWVRSDEVTRSTTPWHMVVELSDYKVYVYKDGVEQFTAHMGIGRDHTRTPTGSYFVAVMEYDVGHGYGPVVVNLSAHSEDIESWQGSGDAITAFHGPFGAQELIRSGGGKVSNGCMRLLEEDQLKMAPITQGTPVDILE